MSRLNPRPRFRFILAASVLITIGLRAQQEDSPSGGDPAPVPGTPAEVAAPEPPGMAEAPPANEKPTPSARPRGAGGTRVSEARREAAAVFLLLGIPLCILGRIGVLIDAAREGCMWFIIVAAIPAGSWLFGVMHWDEVKLALTIELVGTVLVFGGMVL